MSRLAADFDIAPTVLRLQCLEAGIPLPGSGYWSRRRWGKGQPPPPLPPRPPGAADIITLGTYETWWRRRSEMLGEPIPPEPQFDQTVEEVVAGFFPAAAPTKSRRRREPEPAGSGAVRPVSWPFFGRSLRRPGSNSAKGQPLRKNSGSDAARVG